VSATVNNREAFRIIMDSIIHVFSLSWLNMIGLRIIFWVLIIFFSVAVLWWTWWHRSNMCFSNETWSISHLSFNIQNMVEIFKACFNPISNVASEDRLIKWNNDNHFSVILNVGGSCIDSPRKSWVSWGS